MQALVHRGCAVQMRSHRRDEDCLPSIFYEDARKVGLIRLLVGISGEETLEMKGMLHRGTRRTKIPAGILKGENGTVFITLPLLGV